MQPLAKAIETIEADKSPTLHLVMLVVVSFGEDSTQMLLITRPLLKLRLDLMGAIPSYIFLYKEILGIVNAQVFLSFGRKQREDLLFLSDKFCRFKPVLLSELFKCNFFQVVTNNVAKSQNFSPKEL